MFVHFILEYAFGGHPFPFTGIFDMMPRDLTELGEGFNFKYVFIAIKICKRHYGKALLYINMILSV